MCHNQVVIRLIKDKSRYITEPCGHQNVFLFPLKKSETWVEKISRNVFLRWLSNKIEKVFFSWGLLKKSQLGLFFLNKISKMVYIFTKRFFFMQKININVYLLSKNKCILAVHFYSWSNDTLLIYAINIPLYIFKKYLKRNNEKCI